MHIITVNEMLVKEGKPEDFVALTHVWDDDCIGMMRTSTRAPETIPVAMVQMDLEGASSPSKPEVIATCFRSYLEDLCLYKAPRTRIKSLRRKAKRLIAEWEKENP
jgi:hypothetical protein